MRNVFALGAAVLFVGSVSVAVAQERLPQHSGFGTGVGENAGTGTRSQIWDKTALMERLSQAETVYGRVLAIDIPGRKLHLETGGSSHDEGRAGSGAMSSLTLYMDADTNVELFKSVQYGDDVIVTVREETSDRQPYGTGKKMVRDVSVLRLNEKMSGFGGLGQRPNPNTERGIETNSGSGTGGIVGSVLPGAITSGLTSSVGEMTGAAPCWNCEPQPGWGYGTVAPETKLQNKSDYGTDAAKPNLVKGGN